jgi:hypothetical protein
MPIQLSRTKGEAVDRLLVAAAQNLSTALEELRAPFAENMQGYWQKAGFPGPPVGENWPRGQESEWFEQATKAGPVLRDMHEEFALYARISDEMRHIWKIREVLRSSSS